MISSFVENLVLEPNLFIMKIFLSQLYTSIPSSHFNLKTSLGLMNSENTLAFIRYPNFWVMEMITILCDHGHGTFILKFS